MRKAFSFVEVLITIALIAVLAGLSVPFFRNYIIRSELHIAAEQTNQMLRRATILSQSGDLPWGVYVPDGVLYQGNSYPTRDESLDEFFPFPPSVSASGILDVRFSALYAEPSQTGVITLEASNGERIEIPVSGSLGSPTPVSNVANASISFDFVTIKNQGHGSAEPTVYVGVDGTIYAENVSIPLSTNGKKLLDSNLQIGVPGFAMQRTEDYVRILAYGDIESPGGKEVVDARITFNNATILTIENGEGDFITENPFDGNVNNGVGGDEVTQEGTRSIFFQTRTTNYGDSILVYWENDEPREW